MSVLLDTNILTRLSQGTHPMHAAARAATDGLRAVGRHPQIVPQVIYEFWAVATRPVAANGLGLTVLEAQSELARFRGLFPTLPETPDFLPEWERLGVAHDCKGKPAHDARLVAAMRVHGLTDLLTFNGADFARYPGITVLSPDSFLPTPSP